MRIFSRYKNLSNEKTLVHQLNALNQEMDLLQIQLNKVNQLLNDTIAEKCKQELIHGNQNNNNNKNNNSNNQPKTPSNTVRDQSNSLYRASLVPVVGSLNGNSNSDQKSIWKSSSPMQKRTIIQQQNLDSSNEDYQQIHKPKLKSIHQITAQTSSKMSNNSYLSNQNQYYNNNSNNNENTNGSILNLNTMSKSIDSLNMQNNSNNINSNNNSILTNKLFNGSSSGGAFNPTGSGSKKTALLDLNDDKNNEIPISFQPVNFTNSRPKQLNGLQQPSTINISGLVNQQMTSSFVQKGSNFKRDVIAEKKRSSIGKYPNYVVNLAFDFDYDPFIVILFIFYNLKECSTKNIK